jgi:membrane carboxypeptidase/penicillin-binding protein
MAMVGSKDYFDIENQGNFNVAADGLRQPGSAIKPITYATAFKKGYTAATMIVDVPTTFPGGLDNPDYKPENYDSKFRGPLQLRYALGNSINLVAVKLLKMVGVLATLQTAHEMGITTLNEPERYGLSLTLGGGEIKLLDLVSAYGVFANAGVHREVVPLLEVKDSRDRVLEKFEAERESGTPVLTLQQAYLVSDILADNNARTLAFGAYSPLVIPDHMVAVKTGTTDDKKDNWTIGYTPSLVVGVWVGNNDNTVMDPRLASGITGAAPIWHRAMVSFLKDKPNEPFIRPEGLVDVDIDALTGYLPFETAKVRREIFISGTVPTAHSDMYQRLKICKADGKIAAKPCEEAGNYEEKIYVRLKDALPEWQEFTDKWLTENKDKLEPEHSEWYPPAEQSFLYFDENGRVNREEKPLVRILDVRDGATVGSSFPVKVDVISPYTVLKVEVYLDGQLLGPPLTSIPYEKKVTLDKENTGRHRLLVKGYDSGGNVGEKEITVRYQTALGGL